VSGGSRSFFLPTINSNTVGVTKLARHTALPKSESGKGSSKRKGSDNEAYRENLSRILKNKEKDDEPLGFKLTVNGKEV
jgi:hypothetical protein